MMFGIPLLMGKEIGNMKERMGKSIGSKLDELQGLRNETFVH